MKKNNKIVCKFCGKTPIRIIRGKINKCMTCGKLQTKDKTNQERMQEKREREMLK